MLNLRRKAPTEQGVVDPLPLKDHGQGQISVGDGGGGNIMEIRLHDEFEGHAVYLPAQFKYTLGKDSMGLKILVAERK